MPSKKSLQPTKIELVSVILPTYNEAGNIADLIEAIDSFITQPHEIIVVDDNSPDGTSAIVQKIDNPRVRLETRMKNRGLTKSIKRGIELAKGDTVVWMDCDFSMPPQVIPDLLSKIEDGYDISVGSRFVKGGSHKKGAKAKGAQESLIVIALSRFLNLLLRLSLSMKFRDYTSGFIAIRKKVLGKINLQGDYGEYFMDLMYRAILLRYQFIEIPYVCAPRKAGESKTAPNLIVLLKRLPQYGGMLIRLWGLRVKCLFGIRL